tara:strand:+ start:164 stop:313 length:150 start_codon:yes stop_codon:yes gene_type:complete
MALLSAEQARELMRGAAEAHRSERAALRRQLEEQARTKVSTSVSKYLLG